MNSGERPRSEQLSELIESIYSTVDDPTRWSAVLGMLGNVVSARNTLLFLSRAGSAGQDAILCPNTPEELLQRFVDHYASVNVLAEPCDRLFPDATVRYSHWAVPDTEFERSEFYADFFRPLDLHYSVGIKVLFADGGLAYLSSQRPKRHKPFEEEEASVWQMLLPHIRRALLVQAKLGAALNTREAVDAALLHHSKTVFGVNRDGSLGYASAAAEELLREAEVLCVKNGKLRAVQVRDDRRFQACLRQALSPEDWSQGEASGTVVLQRPAAAAPLYLVMLPRTRSVQGGRSEIAALIFIHDSLQQEPSREVALRGLFQLTATEIRIAHLLLAGNDSKEIATQLQMSADAVRFHIKRLLAKTGTRRQAELVKLMLALPSQAEIGRPQREP